MRLINTIRPSKEAALDALSLGAVLLYVAYKFLQSTTFPFVFDNTFRYVLAVLLLCGGLRSLFLLVSDLRICSDQRSKAKALGKWLLTACAAAPFFVVAFKTDMMDLAAMPLTVACLNRLDCQHILRSFLVVVGVLLFATVLCCLTDCIQNISTGILYNSYGIINTTDFAAYLVFLLLCAWCTQRVRTWYTTFLFALLCALVGMAANQFMGSRTAGICCVLLMAAIYWEWAGSISPVLSRARRLIRRAVDALTVGAFPLIATALGWLTYLYGQGSALAQELDAKLSRRLNATWYVYQEQGIHFLGKNFTQHGNGGSMLGPGATYDFLDSAYAYLLIRCGVLVFVAVMAVWMYTTYRAIKAGDKRVALSMAIIALYSFSECQMINANYDLFLFLPLCTFSNEKTLQTAEESNSHERSWWTGLGIGLALVVVCWAMAPKALSWLRTFFYLRQWNSGSRTALALVLSLALAICLCLLAKALTHLALRRERKDAVVTATALAVLACGALVVNATINKGLQDLVPELDAEEPVIQAILDSANGPVYAAEKSELYQRRFGGFTEHAMTVDMLAKDRVGTMLTAKDHEDFRLQTYGAPYLQFSDTSSVYTFDTAVTEALTAAGYTWSSFYNSEQSWSAAELERQKAQPKDQLAGTYEVKLALHVAPDSLANMSNEAPCTFCIVSNNGDVVIAEYPLPTEEFDSEGNLQKTISYTIGNVPRLEFRVEEAEGVDATLEELAWRRTA